MKSVVFIMSVTPRGKEDWGDLAGGFTGRNRLTSTAPVGAEPTIAAPHKTHYQRFGAVRQALFCCAAA
ncbi:MAG: hypothetical protein R3E87_21160 [Burkholderiaceae bacterium]